jgi:DNA-binding NarL/FixJ family response regulator
MVPPQETRAEMNRLILADNQAIFRAGAARMLALEEDMHIVSQCEDMTQLLSAMDEFSGGTAVVGSSLKPDLKVLVDRAKRLGSRVILVTENAEQIPESIVLQLDGIVSRNVGISELLECVRQVVRGGRYIQPSNMANMQTSDNVGAKVRDRLTPKEMQIVALIVQGCKNKEIATQLGTKEQVIKNYLRGIYDKTGVSDRLELALFTIHHRVLAEAAAKAGGLIEMQSA